MSRIPDNVEPRPKNDPTIVAGDLCIQQSTGYRYSFYFWAKSFDVAGIEVAVITGNYGSLSNVPIFVSKDVFLATFRRDISR